MGTILYGNNGLHSVLSWLQREKKFRVGPSTQLNIFGPWFWIWIWIIVPNLAIAISQERVKLVPFHMTVMDGRRGAHSACFWRLVLRQLMYNFMEACTGVIFATKCFLSWVVSHRGTMSLLLVARWHVAWEFLMVPSSSAGIASSTCRILYRKASLETHLLFSSGSNPRIAIILVTLDFCPKSFWIRRHQAASYGLVGRGPGWWRHTPGSIWPLWCTPVSLCLLDFPLDFSSWSPISGLPMKHHIL